MAPQTPKLSFTCHSSSPARLEHARVLAALGGVDAFTARERRVVSIAANGATNREGGEGLFITPKTVAMHLSNAYRKLGITSRRDRTKRDRR